MENQGKNDFNGKLTAEELKELRKKLGNEKEIRKIEYYLEKYKDHLSEYRDLVGDNLVPDKFFLFNLKHFGYLLENDPEKVMSKSGMLFRRHIIRPLIRKFGPQFMSSEQVFENRNDLLLERDYRTGEILPNQDLESLKGKIDPVTKEALPDLE